MVFHARVDLPNGTTPLEEIAGFAERMVTALRCQRATSAVLVAFGTAERSDLAVETTAQALVEAGFLVIDRLRADGGRYWSYRCCDPRCCPPEGTLYDVEGSTVAAEATLAGIVALPDREALIATLSEPQGASLSAIRAATDAARLRYQEARDSHSDRIPMIDLAAIMARYGGGGCLTDEEVACLTVSLSEEPELSRQAIRSIDANAPRAAPSARPPALTAQVALWSDVVRRCEPTLVVPSAVLLAYACWRLGDGVTAGVAVNRALVADPNCPAARLLDDLIHEAVPPPGIGQPEVSCGLSQQRRARHRAPTLGR